MITRAIPHACYFVFPSHRSPAELSSIANLPVLCLVNFRIYETEFIPIRRRFGVSGMASGALLFLLPVGGGLSCTFPVVAFLPPYLCQHFQFCINPLLLCFHYLRCLFFVCPACNFDAFPASILACVYQIPSRPSKFLLLLAFSVLLTFVIFTSEKWLVGVLST